jgi:Cys-rich protein (TIGR01571 family)
MPEGDKPPPPAEGTPVSVGQPAPPGSTASLAIAHPVDLAGSGPSRTGPPTTNGAIPVAPAASSETPHHADISVTQWSGQVAPRGVAMHPALGPMYAYGDANLLSTTADLDPDVYPRGMGTRVLPSTHDLGHFDGRVLDASSSYYSTNLFDCHKDLDACVWGALCTPCQLGESARDGRAGDCCGVATAIVVSLGLLNQLLPCLGNFVAGGFAATVTNRVALNYGITEPTDLITACACMPCVSCRLAREIKRRTAMGQEPIDFHQLWLASGGRINPWQFAELARPRAQEMSRDDAGGYVGADGEPTSRDTMVTYVAVVGGDDADGVQVQGVAVAEECGGDGKGAAHAAAAKEAAPDADGDEKLLPQV